VRSEGNVGGASYYEKGGGAISVARLKKRTRGGEKGEGRKDKVK